MSRNQVIVEIEKGYLKDKLPSFNVGDTVKVHTRIIEGNKERTQVFTGTVIAKKGKGLSETFSVYRIAYGCSMEKVFLLHSPRIAKIEVTRAGKVRRAKLYYLRGVTGKKARVKGSFTSKEKVVKEVKQKVEEIEAKVEEIPAENPVETQKEPKDNSENKE